MVLFNKDNIVGARFINDRKSDIEVIFTDNGQNHATIVQTDGTQEDFIALIDIISIDEIEKQTQAWIEDQRTAIMDFHRKIIEAENIRVSSISSKTGATLSELVVSFDESNEDHKSALVDLKLEVLDNVEGLTAETKAAIREAKTVVEVIKAM